MGHKFSKALSRMTRNEVNEEVDAKRALPDLVLKRVIFEAQERMYDAETTLMYNQLRNNGMTNDSDIYRFRVCILKLFRLIGEMAKEGGCLGLPPNGKHPLYDRYDWELLMDDLAYGKPFKLHMLIRFSAYLTFALHTLNLTNLLISEGTDVMDEESF
jgi:hypothetical protein